MKKITTSALALLLASLTSVALGGCVMDEGDDADTGEEATSEVEQGLIKWPGGKSPVVVCKDSCGASYNQCKLDNGDTNECYDQWQDCRTFCTILFDPISRH